MNTLTSCVRATLALAALLSAACAGPRWRPQPPSGAQYAYRATGATHTTRSRTSKLEGGVKTTTVKASTRTSLAAEAAFEEAPVTGDGAAGGFNAHLGENGEKVTP